MNAPDESRDPLSALRELRSPVGTRAIRERVLERAAAVPLWSQFKSVAAEALVVVLAATAVVRWSLFAGPGSASSSGPIALRERAPVHGAPAASTSAASTAMAAAPSFSVEATRTLRTVSRILPPRSYGSGRNVPAMETAFVSEDGSAEVRSTQPTALEPAVRAGSAIRVRVLPPAPLAAVVAAGSSTSWFVSASGGAMFSELRILSERGEIGFQDRWETIALSYTNAYGAADIHGELLHHPGSTAPFLSKEGEQQYSLLLGATVSAGAFEFRAMAGPALLFSSSQNFAPATGTETAPASSRGLGVSGEASVLYALNSSFQAGITGVASYGSSVNLRQASGVFASINYCFGQ